MMAFASLTPHYTHIIIHGRFQREIYIYHQAGKNTGKPSDRGGEGNCKRLKRERETLDTFFYLISLKTSPIP